MQCKHNNNRYRKLTTMADDKQKLKNKIIPRIIITFDSYKILKIVRLIRDVGSICPNGRRDQESANKKVK